MPSIGLRLSGGWSDLKTPAPRRRLELSAARRKPSVRHATLGLTHLMAAVPNRPVLRERYERRQQEVIEVSARVFADRGYQATGMVDLCEATGLTSGGLYHYIGKQGQAAPADPPELTEPWYEIALEIEQRDDLTPKAALPTAAARVDRPASSASTTT